MFKRIIVISGPVGAGKSTLATALTEFGLRVVKTRELLLTMTKTRNDRGGLQAAGERLDARTGGRWIADAMARQAEILPDNAEVIVDSCLSCGQASFHGRHAGHWSQPPPWTISPCNIAGDDR
jgi:broad-specificity NMP kinase